MIESEDILYYEVKGISMRPFFKTGDRFVVKKSKTSDLRIGEVIAYNSDNNAEVVCHRLVKKVKLKDGFILYARQDSLPDWQVEKIKEERLIGKVNAVIRNNRVINLDTWHQRIINRIIIILLPVIQGNYRIIKNV